MRSLGPALVVGALLSAAAWIARAADPASPVPSPPAPAPPASADRSAGRAATAGADAGVAAPAAAPLPRLAALPQGSSAPDPAPLVAKRQWTLELAYRDGEIALLDARAVAPEKPVPTPRRMGRFALEYYVGPQLLDRVRFDFPLLGGGEFEARRPWNAPPSFERHARTKAVVTIPESDRAVRLVLVDRASGQAWTLPWPLPTARDPKPEARPGVMPLSPQAGAPDAGAPPR